MPAMTPSLPSVARWSATPEAPTSCGRSRLLVGAIGGYDGRECGVSGTTPSLRRVALNRLPLASNPPPLSLNSRRSVVTLARFYKSRVWLPWPHPAIPIPPDGNFTAPALPPSLQLAEMACRFSGINPAASPSRPLKMGVWLVGTLIAMSQLSKFGQPVKVSRHEHQFR